MLLELNNSAKTAGAASILNLFVLVQIVFSISWENKVNKFSKCHYRSNFHGILTPFKCMQSSIMYEGNNTAKLSK